MRKLFILGMLFLFSLSACAPRIKSNDLDPFVIGAIPDQDPEKLQRRFDLLSHYLSDVLDVPVEYKPVTDYAASVSAFRVGDLDMVWFGGLTGVQARLQVDGAQAILQRELDAQFHSVFIAHVDSDILPFDDLSDLSQLKGHSFTFGSQSSTSGRLMPQYFLDQAGIPLHDFSGYVGFSGSHDTTIDLDQAGSYDAGVLNEQVWLNRVEKGDVDLAKVQLIWRSPSFYDYHWVIRPDVSTRYGDDFIDRVTQAFLDLDFSEPTHKEILDLLNTQRFIVTENDNYKQIEAVGREIGKIN